MDDDCRTCQTRIFKRIITLTSITSQIMSAILVHILHVWRARPHICISLKAPFYRFVLLIGCCFCCYHVKLLCLIYCKAYIPLVHPASEKLVVDWTQTCVNVSQSGRKLVKNQLRTCLRLVNVVPSFSCQVCDKETEPCLKLR